LETPKPCVKTAHGEHGWTGQKNETCLLGTLLTGEF